nr:MAG TPA: hypothetical protein [Caudoviricetes sp.]
MPLCLRLRHSITVFFILSSDFWKKYFLRPFMRALFCLHKVVEE